MNVFAPVLAAVLAYLVGSLSFAVIVSRAMGLNDPRSYGSGNPGATNVLRSGSKVAAVLTLLLDALKGLIPVLVVKTWGPQWGLGDGALALVALGAFVGHLFPVFFGFKGGKGVATALGVLLGISGWLGLIVLGIWLVVAFVSRYSSMAALLASLGAPVAYLILDGSLWSVETPLLVAIMVMAALLVWRHRENIGRLIRGEESQIGGGKKEKQPVKPALTIRKTKPKAAPKNAAQVMAEMGAKAERKPRSSKKNKHKK